MCRPEYYDIEYEINPWMHLKDQPDKVLALEQWTRLYETYRNYGIAVEVIPQVKGLPDMVFTANGGLVWEKMFISGNFRYSERKGEEQYFQDWFSQHGYRIITLEHYQGGEGDALFFRNTLYLGYGFRSDIESHHEIGKILGIPTVSLKLINPYFYDFDTTFCPLGDRGVLYYPEAYDEESRARVESIPGSIPMNRNQAENFVGNSVYLNGKLLLSYLDEDLTQTLKSLDIEPLLFPMSEYKKSGGGIKCLTLYIS